MSYVSCVHTDRNVTGMKIIHTGGTYYSRDECRRYKQEIISNEVQKCSVIASYPHKYTHTQFRPLRCLSDEDAVVKIELSEIYKQ